MPGVPDFPPLLGELPLSLRSVLLLVVAGLVVPPVFLLDAVEVRLFTAPALVWVALLEPAARREPLPEVVDFGLASLPAALVLVALVFLAVAPEERPAGFFAVEGLS